MWEWRNATGRVARSVIKMAIPDAANPGANNPRKAALRREKNTTIVRHDLNHQISSLLTVLAPNSY